MTGSRRASSHCRRREQTAERSRGGGWWSVCGHQAGGRYSCKMLMLAREAEHRWALGSCHPEELCTQGVRGFLGSEATWHLVGVHCCQMNGCASYDLCALPRALTLTVSCLKRKDRPACVNQRGRLSICTPITQPWEVEAGSQGSRSPLASGQAGGWPTLTTACLKSKDKPSSGAATKPDRLSPVPRTLMVGETDFCKLFSDLCPCAVVHISLHTHTPNK